MKDEEWRTKNRERRRTTKAAAHPQKQTAFNANGPSYSHDLTVQASCLTASVAVVAAPEVSKAVPADIAEVGRPVPADSEVEAEELMRSLRRSLAG